jgi:hypothetical protein
MHIQSFTKLDIALKQIDTALELYFENKDLFSVITLAGAGEEILGKLLKAQKKENSSEQRTKSLMEIYAALSQKHIEDKAARDILNKAKNSIKHMDDRIWGIFALRWIRQQKLLTCYIAPLRIIILSVPT